MNKLFLCVLIVTVFTLRPSVAQNHLTANQIIELIKGKVTCPWSAETVDTFKSGNPEDAVTGIVVCMFADMKALQQAVTDRCNLIITHEPTFYNHLDDTKSLVNDPVFLEKLKFINDHHLIIWRFHDHIHRTSPDGIYAGMVEKLGWRKNKTDDTMTRFKFEPVKLAQFISQLKTIFPGSAFRVIGNPGMTVTNVAFSAGAPGSSTHLRLLQEKQTDLLIAGESPEWETYQYVHDAQLQGRNKAVIFLGHTNSEEAGMDYCVTWLKGFMPLTLPIHYFENGSSFQTY